MNIPDIIVYIDKINYICEVEKHRLNKIIQVAYEKIS